MARAGRKRKKGKRTKSGRLSRAGQPRFDHGTDSAQIRKAMFGENGADAIGRAYEAGLLGSEPESGQLKTLARNIFNAYWSRFSDHWLTHGRATGGSGIIDEERQKAAEMWLVGQLEAVDRLGVRKEFDGLVIDVNPDCGPDWLDRLISDKKRGVCSIEQGKFKSAMLGLNEIAG